MTPCDECSCITLDRDALRAELEKRAADPGFFDATMEGRPHLFADVTVFVPAEARAQMLAVVAAVEAAAHVPNYIERALARAPEIARVDFGTSGVFMGYDFHLSGDTPRLIEINTNAGGAYLAAAGAVAHRACCGGEPPADPRFEQAAMDMFLAEWRAQRGEARLRRVAIVDTDPTAQYLHPEFLLAKRAFEASEIEAVIVDPGALVFEDGELQSDGVPIDLVYNRLTDFALEDPRHAALRDAYRAGAVLLTPNPRHHALFADKRNLVDLTDESLVSSWDLAPEHARALSTIPETRLVTPQNADALYAERKTLFFKPIAGHGSKGVYRGDKITRGVWSNIVESDYVAQALVLPSERQLRVDGVLERRKLDVRLYTYAGEVLLPAARVYQGQTTNFRTPGGGFAPVFFTE